MDAGSKGGIAIGCRMDGPTDKACGQREGGQSPSRGDGRLTQGAARGGTRHPASLCQAGLALELRRNLQRRTSPSSKRHPISKLRFRAAHATACHLYQKLS